MQEMVLDDVADNTNIIEVSSTSLCDIRAKWEQQCLDIIGNKKRPLTLQIWPQKQKLTSVPNGSLNVIMTHWTSSLENSLSNQVFPNLSTMRF